MLKNITRIFIFAFFLALFLESANVSYGAGTASILVSPDSGNKNIDFNASIVVDGGGTNFNAAAATISVTNNLSIQSLTLGDCNFAFVKTPTAQNPSFTGVILGDSSSKCSVYTLKLRPLSSGTGYIFIYNGSVKSYVGSSEILSSLRGGTYALTSTSTSTPGPTTPPSNDIPTGSDTTGYQMMLTVTDNSGTPVSGASVDVIPASTSTTSDQKSYSALSDSNGVAHVTGIPKGVYKVTADYNGQKLSENILAVDGANKVIDLGVTQKKNNNLGLILIIPILIILGIVAFLLYKKFRRSS